MAVAMATMLASSGLASGTAAAGAAGAAGGLGSLASVGALGTTIVGGLSELFKANAEADVLKEKAAFADFEAEQELLKGKAEALDARRRLNANAGSIITRGAASGLTSSGSVGAAVDDATDAAQFDIGNAEDNAAISSGVKKSQAQQYRAQAGTTQTSGIFGALSHGFNFLGRREARG